MDRQASSLTAPVARRWAGNSSPHPHPVPRVLLVAAVAAIPLVGQNRASAQPIEIHEGMSYDAATATGYNNATFSGSVGVAVSDTGLAVGFADRLSNGVNIGDRAIRLAAGLSAVELTGLTADPLTLANSAAYSINASGQSAGFANKQVGGADLGDRAVRWDAAGSPLELAHLGTDSAGATDTYAYAINPSGQTAGMAAKYDGTAYAGERAVRWNEAGAALELGTLGLNNQGVTYAAAYSINTAGQTVGYAEKYDGNTSSGQRAVRWDAATGAALELGNLGTSNQGIASAFAFAINDSGQTVGYSSKYVSGSLKGDRGVLWDAATGAALELATLGADAAGNAYAYAFAINDAGQTTGRSLKYEAGAYKGERAVRWDALGNALELGHLGLSSTGTTSASAYSINALGQTAGKATRYETGVSQGDRAVYWTADGAAVDLNTLISPGSNWTLTRARAISDNGWIVGFGQFDPDGAGALAAYQRHFLLNITTENSWLSAAGGAWQTGSNWFTHFAPGPAVDALFDLGSANAYTVQVNAVEQARNLVVANDKVLLSLGVTGTLALNGITLGREAGDVATLTTVGGHVTLTGPLTIAAAAGSTGSYTHDGGTLSAPSIVNRGTVILNSGEFNVAEMQLAGGGTLKLSPGGSKTLKLSTLSITDTARLDLAEHKLIVTAGDLGTWNGSAYTGITGLVDAGRGANPNAQWDGSGIVTSDARAIANSNFAALGVATAGQLGRTSFGGEEVNSTDVLVMFTWGGDANLDGRVNIDDYGRIDASVAVTGASGWFNGDFNYDGKINIDDYGIIDANISQQGAAFATGGSITSAAVEGVSSIPEPAAAGYLGLIVALGMRKRTRR